LDHLEEEEIASHPDYRPARAQSPTKAPAGSPEKIEVMRDRVARGEQATHPLDNLRQVDPERSA